MGTIVVICMVISVAVILVGGVMMIVAAFRQGILWGVAYLLVPFAALVFLFKYWSEAKKGFYINLMGACAFVGCCFSFPQARPEIVNLVISRLDPRAAASAKNENDYAQAIEEKRQHVGILQAELAKITAAADVRFNELTSQRTTLNTKDTAAVQQFNVEATAYLRQVEQVKLVTQQGVAANMELEDLLAKQVTEKNNQVVIYSTSWCSVCKTAKRYMDSKGIKYREVDVEKSKEGAEEYRREGGDGSVPLIVKGDKKLKGFDPRALDSML
jgi:glutaredoxin